jgi:hypothetical protein
VAAARCEGADDLSVRYLSDRHRLIVTSQLREGGRFSAGRIA